MESVFLHLLNMSITAGWLVLAVVALRLIFRRAPKWVHCLLWVLVAVRLMCPVSLESALSLIPSAETVPVEDFLYNTPSIHSGVPVVDAVVNPIISNDFAPTLENSVNPMQVVSVVAANLWVLGMVGMVLYAVISTLRLRHRVREAAFVRDNVWQCDAIATPFILGIIRPRIYLPTLLGAEEAKSVIAHEQAHLTRRDHWWKPLGFLLLTVYWFNPLLWLGYILLCRDIEAACDERVVQDMDVEGRKEYSRILLSCSAPRRLVTACPLAFGETGVKSRIKAVLNYRKPAFWLVLTAIVATVAAAVCLLTNPKTTVSDDLDAALSRIILDYNRNEHRGDAYPTEAHTVLGVEKKRGNTVVYAMVLYEEYYLDQLGDLQVQSCSHIPTVLTVGKKDGTYTLVDYRIPRDGSDFVKDIKTLFPARLRGKVDTSLYSEKHRAATLDAARQHFQPWQTALHQAILTNNRKESGDGIFAAESHRIYGVEEGEDRLTVYTLVYYHEYAWENGAVVERSGSLVPTAVTFLKNGDTYDVTEYWTPGDNWEESIRGKFPEHLWEQALTYANYPVEELKAECLAQANAYFGLKGAYAAPLTFSSMNWLSEGQLDALYAGLPTDTLAQYLPVIPMATRADLDAFIAEYKKDFSFDRAVGDGLTPIHQMSFYDDAFFAEKVLLAVYYKDGSCSAQPTVSGVTYTDGNRTLQVQVKVYEPQAGDTALGQWFMLCEVDRSALEGVTAYSAVVHSRTTDTDVNTFTGRVTQVEKGMMLMDCYDKDKFTSVWVLLPNHGDLHPAVGQEYTVTHDGWVMETYPPQVTAVSLIPVSSTPTTSTTQPTTTTTIKATNTTKKTTTTSVAVSDLMLPTQTTIDYIYGKSISYTAGTGFCYSLDEETWFAVLIVRSVQELQSLCQDPQQYPARYNAEFFRDRALVLLQYTRDGYVPQIRVVDMKVWEQTLGIAVLDKKPNDNGGPFPTALFDSTVYLEVSAADVANITTVEHFSVDDEPIPTITVSNNELAEKVYCIPPANVDFEAGQLWVILSESVSADNHFYTADQFSELFGVEITKVEPYRYRKNPSSPHGVFRQMYQLFLPTNTKQAVLDAIKIIEQHPYVYAAEPQYIYDIAYDIVEDT